MPLVWTPINAADEVQKPLPYNQNLTSQVGARLFRLAFAWNMVGPPTVLVGPSNLRMYYSDDSGATWTEADAANRPGAVQAAISGTAFLDGAIIYTAYHIRIAANTWEIRIRPFDTGTLTWGAEIGGGPVTTDATLPRKLYISRRAGEIYIFYNARIAGIYDVRYVKYVAGWGVPVTVSAAEPGTFRLPDGLLLDGNLLHMFFKTGSTVAVPMRLYHRSLDAVDAMGATQLLGQIAVDFSPEISIGPPLIWDNKLILPYPRDTGVPSADPANPGFEHVPAVWIGDPNGVAAPAWASEDVAAAPLADWDALSDRSYSVAAVVDAPALVAFWCTPQNIWVALNVMMTASKNPGGAWSAAALYFNPPGPTNPSIDDYMKNPDATPLGVAGTYVYVDRVNASFTPLLGNEFSESGFLFDAPLPPALTPARQTGGTRRIVVLVPNKYDHCLYDDKPGWRKIPRKEKCCVGDPWNLRKSMQPPKDWIPFRKATGIATPAPADGDVLVVDLVVPLGYDGVIRGNAHWYSGPGFVDGSGDILWRLQVGRVYARHLGNMAVTLGRPQQTHPIRDGIWLRTLEPVRYIVNVPNLSGGILIGASRIVCVIEGWFLPRK